MKGLVRRNPNVVLPLPLLCQVLINGVVSMGRRNTQVEPNLH
jgi:hypothetical protein